MSGDPEEGTAVSLQFSGQLRSGQAESILVGAAGTIERYTPGHHLYFSAAVEWGDTEGSTYVDRRFVHLRYRRPEGYFGQVESFLQAEEDGIRGLRARTLAGMGLRWTMGDLEARYFAMGLSAMGEHEVLAREFAVAGENRSTSLVRVSSYAAGQSELAPGWTLSTTTYLQPKATDPGDLRLLSNSGLRVKPGERAALETHLHLAYDTRPPPGVESFDIVLKQGLTLWY